MDLYKDNKELVKDDNPYRYFTDFINPKSIVCFKKNGSCRKL